MCDQGLQSKSIKLKKHERVGELHFFDTVEKLVHLHLLLWLQSSVKVFLKELLSRQTGRLQIETFAPSVAIRCVIVRARHHVLRCVSLTVDTCDNMDD